VRASARRVAWPPLPAESGRRDFRFEPAGRRGIVGAITQAFVDEAIFDDAIAHNTARIRPTRPRSVAWALRWAAGKLLSVAWPQAIILT